MSTGPVPGYNSCEPMEPQCGEVQSACASSRWSTSPKGVVSGKERPEGPLRGRKTHNYMRYCQPSGCHPCQCIGGTDRTEIAHSGYNREDICKQVYKSLLKS